MHVVIGRELTVWKADFDMVSYAGDVELSLAAKGLMAVICQIAGHTASSSVLAGLSTDKIVKVRRLKRELCRMGYMRIEPLRAKKGEGRGIKAWVIEVRESIDIDWDVDLSEGFVNVVTLPEVTREL